MESPWVLWLVSQIEKHIFRYWIFPGWRKMEVALTWHHNPYRQQAREHLGVTLQLPVAEAPIKPALSDCLVLLPLPYKFLWLCLDDRPTSMLEIACQAFWLCPVPQGHGVPLQKSQSVQDEVQDTDKVSGCWICRLKSSREWTVWPGLQQSLHVQMYQVPGRWQQHCSWDFDAA